MGRTWLSTVPTILLLGAVLLHGTAGKVHARFLQLGESIWSDYAGLRSAQVRPECDPNAVAGVGTKEAEESDDFLGELMGEEEPSDTEAAEQAAVAARESCLRQHAQYEEQIVRLLSMVCEAEGYNVVTRADGASAVDALGAQDFDLVITDLAMPGLSGEAVLIAAKALEPPVPVVIVTARSSDRVEARLGLLGADDIVRKPFEMAETLL